MNPELQIRNATEQDLGEAIALHKAAYATAYVGVETDITAQLLRDHVYDPNYGRPSFGAQTEENHYSRVNDADVRYRIASIGREVVGFAMTLSQETHGSLDSLYIHPAYQGKRIGSLLLWDAEEGAPNGKLSLMAVVRSRAYAFYTARGYHDGSETSDVPLVGGPVLKLRELRNF